MVVIEANLSEFPIAFKVVSRLMIEKLDSVSENDPKLNKAKSEKANIIKNNVGIKANTIIQAK